MKCNAFFSKIIKTDNPIDKMNLMKVLRNSNNDFIADEIAMGQDSSLTESQEEKLEEITENENET